MNDIANRNQWQRLAIVQLTLFMKANIHCIQSGNSASDSMLLSTSKYASAVIVSEMRMC